MWVSYLKRCLLQRFFALNEVVATGFRVVIIFAIVIIKVGFLAKVLMVEVVEELD